MLKRLFFFLSMIILLDSVVMAKPEYGIAMHGKPKYGPKDSFDYVNVDAPKGG